VDVALDANATDLDALKAAKLGDATLEQAVADLSAKIGEKLELHRVADFDGRVDPYLHKRSSAPACLPRGAMCGPAARADYADSLGFTSIRWDYWRPHSFGSRRWAGEVSAVRWIVPTCDRR